jgi:hypothetical protein
MTSTGGRSGLLAAEGVDQTDEQHVDVALVADRIVHAVALPLPPQREGPREVVLKADAVLIVGIALLGIGVGRCDGGAGAGARERVLGLGVDHAQPAKGGELLRKRQNAERIQIHALELHASGKRTRRRVTCREAELTEVEVAPFDGEVLVELVAAKQLVADVGVLIVERDPSDRYPHLGGDPIVADPAFGLADAQSAVPA